MDFLHFRIGTFRAAYHRRCTIRLYVLYILHIILHARFSVHNSNNYIWRCSIVDVRRPFGFCTLRSIKSWPETIFAEISRHNINLFPKMSLVENTPRAIRTRARCNNVGSWTLLTLILIWFYCLDYLCAASQNFILHSFNNFNLHIHSLTIEH